MLEETDPDGSMRPSDSPNLGRWMVAVFTRGKDLESCWVLLASGRSGGPQGAVMGAVAVRSCFVPLRIGCCVHLLDAPRAENCNAGYAAAAVRGPPWIETYRTEEKTPGPEGWWTIFQVPVGQSSLWSTPGLRVVAALQGGCVLSLGAGELLSGCGVAEGVYRLRVYICKGGDARKRRGFVWEGTDV